MSSSWPELWSWSCLSLRVGAIDTLFLDVGVLWSFYLFSLLVVLCVSMVVLVLVVLVVVCLLLLLFLF